MTPWLFRSLVLTAACVASGISGYSFGVHSSPAKVSASSKVSAASPAIHARAADADVLVPPPSWQRWPQATDF
jgi:hypothetical protein